MMRETETERDRERRQRDRQRDRENDAAEVAKGLKSLFKVKTSRFPQFTD